MKIYLITALLLTAATGLFCRFLLRDDSFFSDGIRHPLILAGCTAVSSLAGTAAGAYLCTAFNALGDAAMRAAFCTGFTAVSAFICAAAAKKLLRINGVYIPALVLYPVVASLCAALFAQPETASAIVFEGTVSVAAVVFACALHLSVLTEAKRRFPDGTDGKQGAKKRGKTLFCAFCLACALLTVIATV